MFADALGFAAGTMMRRIVGVAQVADSAGIGAVVAAVPCVGATLVDE